MDIIYCAGGGKILAEIAIVEGFLYGSRSDDIREVPRCNGLIDIDWKNYDWEEHKFAVKEHRPKYAVVPDVCNEDDLSYSMKLAQEIEKHCENVIVVPKVKDIIYRIPNKYIIGISVPTSYSGFIPRVSNLEKRKIHLLGGSPNQQKELWKYYSIMGLEVTSVDINCHNKASNYGNYWNGYKWVHEGKHKIDKYEAFRRSCVGILSMWEELGINNHMEYKCYNKDEKYYIRKAKKNDIEQIKEIADNETNALGFVNRKAFLEGIDNKTVFVACVGQEIIGFQQYYHRKRDQQTTLYRKAVKKEWRNQGVGTKLVDAVVKESRILGRKFLLLKCPIDNRSNIFHKKYGFQKIDTENGRRRKLNVYKFNL